VELTTRYEPHISKHTFEIYCDTCRIDAEPVSLNGAECAVVSKGSGKTRLQMTSSQFMRPELICSTLFFHRDLPSLSKVVKDTADETAGLNESRLANVERRSRTRDTIIMCQRHALGAINNRLSMIRMASSYGICGCCSSEPVILPVRAERWRSRLSSCRSGRKLGLTPPFNMPQTIVLGAGVLLRQIRRQITIWLTSLNEQVLLG